MIWPWLSGYSFGLAVDAVCLSCAIELRLAFLLVLLSRASSSSLNSYGAPASLLRDDDDGTSLSPHP